MTATLWVRGAVTMELGVGKTAGQVFCRVGGMSSVLARLNLNFLGQIGSWMYELGV